MRVAAPQDGDRGVNMRAREVAMVIATKKVRRCRCWANRSGRGPGRRMQCQREAGHDGNHVVIDSTTSWGARGKRSR
jgi:hypothetical protein